MTLQEELRISTRLLFNFANVFECILNIITEAASSLTPIIPAIIFKSSYAHQSNSNINHAGTPYLRYSISFENASLFMKCQDSFGIRFLLKWT